MVAKVFKLCGLLNSLQILTRIKNFPLCNGVIVCRWKLRTERIIPKLPIYDETG